MEFLPEKLERYVEAHTSSESDVLSELNRETHAKVLSPQMLSGHLQGRFLSMISKIVQPKTILEIGTFTGYSALCLSEGLSPGGILYTIDINAELQPMINYYFNKAGKAERIRSIVGNALEIIPHMNETFDLVFIDADKENYSNYYELVLPKLRQGGLILADNMLWSGKVVKTRSG